MRRLMIVLCAFAMMAAVASPALAEERMYGAESPVKSAVPTGLNWGFSKTGGLALAASSTFGQLSSSARIQNRLTPAFGGGTNISTSEELPSSGVPSGTVNASTHPHDVYWFYLEAGARIEFYLVPETPSAQIQLRLFSPDAQDINVQSPIKTDSSYVYPPNFDYTAPVEGYYCIDVYAASGASNYTLDYDLYMTPNDDIPAVPISASPISDWSDEVWDVDDVYRLPLRAGDRLSIGLTTVQAYSSSDLDLDLFLLGPASTSVEPHSETNSVAHSWYFPPSAESIVYTAPTSGNYYIDVANAQGWGVSNLTWSVNPIRPAFTRSPSAGKLTYKRKRGKAKFTLKAKMLNQFGLPLKSTKVYLQTSSNGRSWKNSYTMYTNSAGWLTKTITAKKKSTKYYRWYRPKTTTNTSAQTGSQRVVIK